MRTRQEQTRGCSFGHKLCPHMLGSGELHVQYESKQSTVDQGSQDNQLTPSADIDI